MRLGAPARIALVGGLAAFAWASLTATPHLLGRRSPVDAIEGAFADLRLLASGPVAVEAPVVVVGIDDRTLEEGGGYPVPRDRLAAIVDAVRAAGASAIAVDVLLVNETSAEADGALAEALGRGPSVVAAAARFGQAAAGGPVPAARSILWPAAVFAERADVGMVNVVSSATGTPQHLPLVILTRRGLGTHIVLSAAAAYSGLPPRLAGQRVVVGENDHPLDMGLHLPLRIAGPTGTVPTVPAVDVLEGVGHERVAGRLAMVGFTASGVGDTFATPFDPVTPGVEILAGAVAQLLGGESLVRTTDLRRLDAAASTGLAVAGTVLVALLPLAVGVLLACGLLTLWLLTAMAAFEAGLWLSMGLPIAAAGPAIAGAALARHLYERRLAARARQGVTMLQRFQSPALARRLAEDPRYLEKPETRRLAVLFVDLAGFTGLSETLGPERTEALLRAFHARVADVVHDHGGVVLNYMGDGALAVFGIPDGRADDADRALGAAVALVKAIRTLAVGAPDAPSLDGRAGVHMDTVVLSRLGHAEQQQVTVTGDGVNLASRLMDVAKSAGANVAASAAATDALTAPPSPAPDALFSTPIRGRRAAVDVALWTLPRDG